MHLADGSRNGEMLTNWKDTLEIKPKILVMDYIWKVRETEKSRMTPRFLGW